MNGIQKMAWIWNMLDRSPGRHGIKSRHPVLSFLQSTGDEVFPALLFAFMHGRNGSINSLGLQAEAGKLPDEISFSASRIQHAGGLGALFFPAREMALNHPGFNRKIRRHSFFKIREQPPCETRKMKFFIKILQKFIRRPGMEMSGAA